MQVRWLCGAGKAKLQVVENRVWRQIFRCTNVYTDGIVAGGVGASIVEGRDRKIKLGFGRYMLKTKNWLLRAIFRRVYGEIRPGRWMRQYMGGWGLVSIG